MEPFITFELEYSDKFVEELENAKKVAAGIQKDVVALHIKTRTRVTLPAGWYTRVRDTRKQSESFVRIVELAADSISGRLVDANSFCTAKYFCMLQHSIIIY